MIHNGQLFGSHLASMLPCSVACQIFTRYDTNDLEIKRNQEGETVTDKSNN